MDFWRIYRLLLAKRWIIAAVVLMTGAVVFAGTALRALNKEYAAEALLQPQDPATVNSDNGANAAQNNNQNPNEQRVSHISELLILLRSSSDLTNRAATLLKLNDEDRHKEVFRILRKNGYFAQMDADVQSQATEAVKSGELLASKEKAWIKEQREKAQNLLTDSLAKPTDESGGFGAGGVSDSPAEIKKRVRKIVAFESVEGPFSTDDTPQVVNQIRIVAHSPRSAEAELYANMVSVAFLDFYTNRSIGSLTARIELLEEKLKAARVTYAAAREGVVAYTKSSPAAQYSGVQNAVLANVQGYENSLNATRQELAGYEASVSQLRSLLAASNATATVPLPSGENPRVRTLESRVADLRIAFSRVQESNYDTGSDVYKQAQAELSQAEAELKRAQKEPFSATALNTNRQDLVAALGSAQVKQRDAQSRVMVLQNQVAAEREKLKTLPLAAAKLADLSREAALRQDAVARLEKALADAELQAIERGRAGTVSIVSAAQAELVEGMTTGQRLKIIVYGMTLALVFACLLFVALDQLDNAVKTVGDAQRLMNLSVIGQIPSHLPDLLRAPRIVALDPLSPAAESYRLLRSDLIFLCQERAFKSLVVAPIRPGQGATTTAGNLAIALAQSGRKVILIDADLRRPKLHAVFNVSNEAGVSGVLTGQTTYDAALLPTDVENLRLLPAGSPVLNPSELIGSGMMGALLKKLGEMAEFVIVDTPSPASFADGAVLASLADATLLVLRAGQAPDGSLEAQVQARLQKARANVLGMVLNDVEPERLLGSRPVEQLLPLALGNGNVATYAPLPALPKPVSLSVSSVSNETDYEYDIEDEEEDEGDAPPTSKPIVVGRPRIVSTAIPTPVGAGSNGTGKSAPKITRKTDTPLSVLFIVGLSAAQWLTFALSLATA